MHKYDRTAVSSGKDKVKHVKAIGPYLRTKLTDLQDKVKYERGVEYFSQ